MSFSTCPPEDKMGAAGRHFLKREMHEGMEVRVDIKEGREGCRELGSPPLPPLSLSLQTRWKRKDSKGRGGGGGGGRDTGRG